jgi:nucleoside-diphosphate-sugar epimerase
MKKVLITGATGFIGQFALEPLRELGFEVHAVTSRALPDDNGHGEGVIWHRANLLEPQDIAQLTTELRASHLLHLAWYVEHGKFWDAPENDLWLEASKDLFDQFVAKGGQRIVAAGTCAEYDWESSDKILSEATSLIAPVSRYGRAKNDLHRYLADLGKLHGVSYAWGRIFYLFGPGERAERFVPTAIKTILNDETFVCNSPNDVKDFMYVRDVASAFAQILASDVRGAVNVASGTGTRLDMLVEQIMGLCRSGGLSIGPDASKTGTAVISKNDRLVHEVGFNNSMDLKGALRQAIDWWDTRLTVLDSPCSDSGFSDESYV